MADCDRLTFELLLGTGIRLVSLVGLNRGDVDFEASALHIRTKSGPPMADERVFLNPQVCAMLAHHFDETASQRPCGRDTPVFRSKSGRRLRAGRPK